MTRIIIQICLFFVFYKTCDCVYMVPDQVSTSVGSSYVLLIRADDFAPVDCMLSDSKNNYTIDLKQAAQKIESKTQKNVDIMTSLGNGICGFKMDQVSAKSVPVWSFTITAPNGTKYSAHAGILVYEHHPNKLKNIEIIIGDSFMIDCVENQLYVHYCALYNPRGELVKAGDHSCFYSSKMSKHTDLGQWKCTFSYYGSMIEGVVEYNVTGIEPNIISTWTNETDTHIDFGCAIENVPTGRSPSFCKMVRPDGQNFKLMPGSATDRYTTINTDLKNSVCSLQIRKPLAANEWGVWRCEQYQRQLETYPDTGESPIGAFINITKNGVKAIQSEPMIPESVFVHFNKTLDVSCRVPYSSPYCYMRGPDGLIYPVENNRLTTLGWCRFIKEQIPLTDNGTWYCGFGKINGEPDDLYSFQVHIPEVIPVHPESQSVAARSGHDTVLKCTTRGLGDYPLQYCRFLSPNGQMYFINETYRSARISYEGKGLKQGECGIKIKDVKISDTGTWSCITRIGHSFKEPEVYTNIHMAIDDNLSQASVIGIVFGVGIVVIGIGMIAVWKWRKQQPNHALGSDVMYQRNHRASDTSDTNIVINNNNNTGNE